MAITRRTLTGVLGAVWLGRATRLIGATGRRAPRRLVEGWHAHNAILIMLGAAQQIVATVARPSWEPWMFYLVPELQRAVLLRSGPLNVEDIVRLKADLLILPQAEKAQMFSLKEAGILTVLLHFTDFAGLLDTIDQTAVLLGTPLAARRAKAYRTAFSACLAELSLDSFSGLSSWKKRPKVVHVATLAPLQVDGEQTIVSEWIHAAGGQNVVTVRGNHRTVTAEQILAWNPDILILAANAGAVSRLMDDPVLSRLQAVRNGRVYRNPSGIFLWDRYGPEMLLQIRWARQIIISDTVNVPDMINAIEVFYHDFYGITLKQGEAERMLAALPPL